MLNDVMCHRVGAPPLRFRGTLLSHREVQGAGAERLFVTLWARETRNKRDLVVAFSDRRCDWRAHALVAANLNAALGVVESRCDAMRLPVSSTAALSQDVRQDDLIVAIQDRCRDSLDIRRFRQLASVALDEWCTLFERGGGRIETRKMEGT